jgi:hypothetical protein
MTQSKHLAARDDEHSDTDRNKHKINSVKLNTLPACKPMFIGAMTRAINAIAVQFNQANAASLYVFLLVQTHRKTSRQE